MRCLGLVEIKLSLPFSLSSQYQKKFRGFASERNFLLLSPEKIKLQAQR